MKKHLGLSRLYKIIGLSIIIWIGKDILPVFADWPCWRGPYGSGVAIPCGRPIINDLSEMQLVWRSEEQDIPANAWHNSSHGGYDSPIVAQGRVIISYFLGTGDVLDETIKDRGYEGESLRRIQAVAAEHIVLCVDAKTGKTLWKVPLDIGPNMYQRRKRPGIHHSPCWSNGKVYAQSLLGKVYCLDGATGRKIWSKSVPQTAQNEKVLSAYLATGKQHPYRGVEPPELAGVGLPYSFKVPLQVADKVVVCDGGPFVAFDAETGQELWQIPGTSHCAPLRWEVKGKEYFILGNKCVEPRTGKILWEIKGINTDVTPTLGEGYIVYTADKKGIYCFAITPTGYKEQWVIPDIIPGGYSVGVIWNGWYYAQAYIRPPKDGYVEKIVAIELATGKQLEPLLIQGIEQTLCTSLVATDGRLFGQAGAGFSGMFMVEMDPVKFGFVGERIHTVKTEGGQSIPTKAKEKLDYCLTSTPAIVDGRIYFRGSNCLWCYDLKAKN